MKIRTDFVTNSSSSSFVVEIAIKTTDGKEFLSRVDPNGGDGIGDANILCSAEDVLKSESVEELTQLLTEKIVVNVPEEDIVVNMPEEAADCCAENIATFFNNVAKEIKSIGDIDTITFSRIWSAWGEGASCFGWNLDYFAEELPELAEQVCELDGEEKENAKKALQNYLSKFPGTIEGEWGGCFPSGFMKTKAKGSIVWTGIANNIEEFAQKVMDEDLPNDDYAVETITVDMQSKKVTQRAEYILGGNSEEDEIAECEAAIETMQAKTEACEVKFEGYTSEVEIQNRLAQIASEISATEAEIPKSLIEMTESEAERQYFASELMQDIVNKKEPSLESKMRKRNLPLAKVGDIVEFGSYRQSTDVDAEKTAIEWEVLAKENERILLISKYELDCKPYDVKREAVTWETSSIRRWLNGEFMQAAFTSDEQKWIVKITVENSDNSVCLTNGGKNTKDKIFLLSIDEAEAYFASNETRVCTPTAYAVANGAHKYGENGNCWWWLRSPGCTQRSAASVYTGGGVNADGLSVDVDYGAVRPALWVNLES